MVSDKQAFTHYRTCNLCEAMCGIAIDMEDGKIKAIRGDKDDPFSQGHICPKATALQDVYEDPNRLKLPVRRTESGWQQISWTEAFDEIAGKIKAIQAEYGANAVAVYQGNPNVHNLGSILGGPPFIRALKSKNRFSATSVDQLPHHFAAYFMFGHQLLLPIPDVDRTQYFLMLGANPIASNGSLMTAAGIGNRLKALQKRGGKLVTVDPRRTETAEIADEHIFIKPGADVLFLLGILNTLFAENLIKPGRLETMIEPENIDIVQSVVADYTPEKVSGPTGIDADVIRRIAREFAAAESAVCYGRVGTSTQAFGGLAHWFINLINVLTGNLDNPGGAMFTLPAVDIVGLTSLTGQTGNFGRWRSRVRKLPEFSGELPVSVLAEEILTPGEGQIRCLITSSGNPVLSTPNGTQLEKALAGLDYMVAVDIYINETTRHANIILPPAAGLETEHYDIVFHTLAVRNTAKFSEALFPKSPGALYDYEIFRELRIRLEGSARPGKRDYLKKLIPRRVVDMGLRMGAYGTWSGKKPAGEGLTLAMLRRHPHGIDLGALKPVFPKRLATDDKLINLAPPLFVQDMPRVERTFFGDTDGRFGDLALIGRRHVRSNNSWMHNSERLVRGKNRCTLMMHPGDAEQRGLADGQEVCVQSRVGQVTLPVEITPDIMPGVVSMPHGWGHNRPGIKLDVAEKYAGVSINDLTDDAEIDTLTGNAAFSGIPVTVTGAK